MIKHKSYLKIKSLGIFKNIKDFKLLEKRIEKISTKNASNLKGDIFEIFVQGLILNDANFNAKIVYPSLKQTPVQIRKKLRADSKRQIRRLNEIGKVEFKIAKSSNKFLIPAPFVTLSPTYQAINLELKNKTIGNISLARARYGWAGPDWGEWYYKTGGGPLFDLGVYNITTLTGLLGPVKNLVAKSSLSSPYRTINKKKIKAHTNDNFQIMLEFKNGCIGVVTTGFTMQQYKSPAIELYGSSGTIQMLGDDWEPKGFEIWRNSRSSWELYNTPYANWPWASGFNHLIECILKKKRPSIKLDHAYHVNEIMIKINESSKKNKEVSIGSSFKPLKFTKKVKIKKGHLDHDRDHDGI